ncbi:hypothetical protein F511_22557 [Dorcoceras hygrometricum]|uniref:Uncharacterized protein n=1 Tax=Dorcoceras hygrometricum TaxID=472368 RepID=A0A2Z7CYM3_9LAMI|nr:hypothetical protein F511_22557 [Dorcoceras hygrometricum]
MVDFLRFPVVDDAALSKDAVIEDKRQYRAPHLPAGSGLVAINLRRSSVLVLLVQAVRVAVAASGLTFVVNVEHTAAPPQGRSGGSSRGGSFPVQQQRMGETQHRPFQ